MEKDSFCPVPSPGDGGAAEKLSGACVLITGGTGSFGGAFLRRCLALPVGEVRVFSRDERKQYSLARRYEGEGRLRLILGDVRDAGAVDRAMAGVDYVFHAAAMKQIPACEAYPLEAVKTNVLGSAHVLESALRRRVKKVVCLSTDKACYPTSAMGATKSLMEKEALRAGERGGETVVNVTRFGNLVASRGSVVPLFREQLERRGEITVTDPEMTRFLMTVEEAVELVLRALILGGPGELFVAKAKAAAVGELARAVMACLGVSGTIRVTGARAGEKRHETLLLAEEAAAAQDCGGFFRVAVPAIPASEPGKPYRSCDGARFTPRELTELIRAALARPAEWDE